MKKTLLGVGAMVIAGGMFAAAQQGRPAPDPRSMGGGDCAQNPYNCKDAANPLPKAETVWLEEMTWMDVRDAMTAGKTTVIIPTGGIEPNGPWLVLGKHNYVLQANCDAIARKMGNALCAPIIKLVPEGDIDPPTGHMTRPAPSRCVRTRSAAILTDTAQWLKAHGFKHIFFIGDSGGNQAGQRAVAETLNAKWAGKALVAHIQEYYDYASVAASWKQGPQGRQVGQHARRPDHHAEHVHGRPEVGAVGRAREGGQGHDQRRRHRQQGEERRVGKEDRRVPRRPRRSRRSRRRSPTRARCRLPRAAGRGRKGKAEG